MGSRDQGIEQRPRFANGAIRSYRDLVAWQKAYALGLEVYRSTSSFPNDERFGLTQQMRRCALGIASNIAEGYGRSGRTDYCRFLKIARGSLYELDTQMSFAGDLGYLPTAMLQPLKTQLDECERVLAGLIRAIDADGSAT